MNEIKTRTRTKAQPRGSNRPIAGFYADDVPTLVERWRSYAQASEKEETSARFNRLADQLEMMVMDGRCSFTSPILPIRVTEPLSPSQGRHDSPPCGPRGNSMAQRSLLLQSQSQETSKAKRRKRA